MRSSPGNGSSRPPLRKKVTWGYFSVSAMWNWRLPAALTTAAIGSLTGRGGTPIDTGSRLLRAWENTQLNRVMGDVSPIEGAWMEVWTDTVDGAFAVYGSVLDNLTSDPTTVLPQ